MGSPEFSVPILANLAREFEVVGVVTQPDKPAGRKKILTSPPVKSTADDLGIKVLQPEVLKEPGVFEMMQKFQPDLIVVAAYGQILRSNILNLPKFGCINVHASYLPRWRGASPIYAALLNGDQTSGVSIIRMDAGIDTGDVLVQESMPIQLDDTQDSLSKKLSYLGAEMVVKAIPSYTQGDIIPRPQDESKATYCSQLKKEDGVLDFTKPAEDLERQVRACDPWPGAYFYFGENTVRVLSARVNKEIQLAPGQRGIVNRIPVIGTGRGSLEILELQPAGKASMTGNQFINGVRNWVNSRT